MAAKWQHVPWAVPRKLTKSQSNSFLCLKKRFFHVRLKISSWYSHISKVPWKWEQLCTKGFWGEFIVVWIISLGPVWIQVKFGILLLKKVNSAQGFEPVPLSLGSCCHGGTTCPFPFKSKNNTHTNLFILCHLENKDKFKISARFIRGLFSSITYLPAATVAYN